MKTKSRWPIFRPIRSRRWSPPRSRDLCQSTQYPSTRRRTACADRQKVVDEFTPLVNREGDPAAGKLVFTKQCAKCHTHTAAGAEGKVGPDLSGFAVHPKPELLIAILDPSRSVEGNFKAYTATTDDGRQITGLLGSESKTAVELVDAEGKRHSIFARISSSLFHRKNRSCPRASKNRFPPMNLRTCWRSSPSTASICQCRWIKWPPSTARTACSTT